MSLTVLSEIGKGGYGSVYRVQKGEEELALKCFAGGVDGTENPGLDCPWELEILFRNVPGCVHGIEKTCWNGNIGVLLPLADMDLRDYLRTGGGSKEEISSLISQTCYNLANLHGHGFYHLDLKPENILVYSNEFLLADFSISRPDFVKNCSQDFATISFRPPELFPMARGKPLTDKIDSWSLGILLLEILTGFRLNGKDSIPVIQKKITETFSPGEKRNNTLARVPKKYRGIVDGLLRVDPKKRLSVREIVSSYSSSPIEIKVAFYQEDSLAPYYDKIFEMVRDRRGTWLTCLHAVTLITEYAGIKGKVFPSLIPCAVKLSFQLQEDRLFDYREFSWEPRSLSGGLTPSPPSQDVEMRDFPDDQDSSSDYRDNFPDYRDASTDYQDASTDYRDASTDDRDNFPDYRAAFPGNMGPPPFMGNRPALLEDGPTGEGPETCREYAEEELVEIERDLVLTLPALLPETLTSPYPQIVLEELKKKI